MFLFALLNWLCPIHLPIENLFNLELYLCAFASFGLFVSYVLPIFYIKDSFFKSQLLTKIFKRKPYLNFSLLPSQSTERHSNLMGLMGNNTRLATFKIGFANTLEKSTSLTNASKCQTDEQKVSTAPTSPGPVDSTQRQQHALQQSSSFSSWLFQKKISDNKSDHYRKLAMEKPF